MPQQPRNASLDAFDALLVGDSAVATRSSRPSSSEGSPYSGPVGLQPRTRREARALREAQQAMSALVGPSPISAPTPVVSAVDASPAPAVAPASAAPVPAPVVPTPLTRRELREREARELVARTDTVPLPVGAERAAPRPAPATLPERSLAPRRAVQSAPLAARIAASTAPKRRGKATVAAIAAFGLVPALIISPMMFAQHGAEASAASVHTAVAAQGLADQLLKLNDAAVAQKVETFDVASSDTLNKVHEATSAADQSVLSSGGFDDPDAKADMANAGNVVSADLQLGGRRQLIVETALDYIGTPYALGGASKAGIDCSGLTLRAYGAVGITLAHYVPTQDAQGVRIPASQAKPGDLVTFDDEDHIGIYLGGNLVLHAPDWGRPVQIESLAAWSSIPYHFTRVLTSTK